MSTEARLRGKAPRRTGPYPLGELPDDIVVKIARQLVHRIAVGQSDVTGDDFGEIFANSIGGIHRKSPLGIADVDLAHCAWSVKTVKDSNPLKQDRVRVISGRNSPAYSHGIHDVHEDVSATGRAVLDIWNARINEALKKFDDLRILVFIRNFEKLEFALFELSAERFTPTNYSWEVNEKGNFEGHDANLGHVFTWQPHGSQFTIIHHVPRSVYRFKIGNRPKVIDVENVLTSVGFDVSWVEKIL